MKKIRVKLNRKGFSLIEIVVALGISVVSLTGSAVLSTRLIERAQMNFNEESAIQLQSLLSEQLRIIESGMKKNVSEGVKCAVSGSTYTCGTGGYLDKEIWESICANDFRKYRLGFPEIKDTVTDPDDHQDRIRIVDVTAVDKPTGGYDSGSTYAQAGLGGDGDLFGGKKATDQIYFYNLDYNFGDGNNTITDRFGAFDASNSPVYIYIDKRLESSGLGIQVIRFRTKIKYEVLGRERFSDLDEIEMTHISVCGV